MKQYASETLDRHIQCVCVCVCVCEAFLDERHFKDQWKLRFQSIMATMFINILATLVTVVAGVGCRRHRCHRYCFFMSEGRTVGDHRTTYQFSTTLPVSCSASLASSVCHIVSSSRLSRLLLVPFNRPSEMCAQRLCAMIMWLKYCRFCFLVVATNFCPR